MQRLLTVCAAPAAYRKQAMKFHPVSLLTTPRILRLASSSSVQYDFAMQDKNKDPGATEKFKDISEAYDVRSA